MLGKLHLRVAIAALVLAGSSAHGSGAAVPPLPATGPPVTAAPPTVRAETTTTTVPEATTTTVPEATTTTVPEATTTTVPEATTTTAAPAPPEATTTTTTAPPPTTTTTAPAPRVPAAGPSRQEQIEAIADSTGWDWRAAGVRLTVGFYPDDCCHWGVYESARRTVWIGPTAFANAERLRYVVLHELAHGWQYTRDRFPQLLADYQPYGMDTYAQALEAGGDCIATLWGATDSHYWACPEPALRTAARRLAGDWS